MEWSQKWEPTWPEAVLIGKRGRAWLDRKIIQRAIVHASGA